MCFELLEDVLPADHPARVLWRVVETLDLSAFLKGRKSFEGQAGRDVTSPHVLLTLWLYAMSIGVGSARGGSRGTKRSGERSSRSSVCSRARRSTSC